ncbi:MAG: energy-coupling factor ABC transporter ATP-binding protein [Candidatus Ranarchaeia archaeon]
MGLISVKDFSFKYAGSKEWSLKDINLEINQGDFVLIIGPTGCGKTTLCRTFNGLIPHFYGGEIEGDILVEGKNTKSLEVYDLAKTAGMVFQNPENQLIALNVERELTFAPENLGLKKEEIKTRLEEVIKILNLESIRKTPPFELSGGEQQKVAVGSVLTLKPKVLVLDEPTANLDPLTSFNILTMVNDLNKKLGVTVFIAEHKIDFIAPIVNRIIVMDSGKIRFDGKPRDVFSSQILEEIGVMNPKIVQLYKESRFNRKNQKIPLDVKEAVDLILGDLK